MGGWATGSGNPVEWQQLYAPADRNITGGGIGYSQGYIDKVNADRLREAMLAAQQINQASNVTQAQEQTLSQTAANQTYLESLRSPTPTTSATSGAGSTTPAMPKINVPALPTPPALPTTSAPTGSIPSAGYAGTSPATPSTGVPTQEQQNYIASLFARGKYAEAADYAKGLGLSSWYEQLAKSKGVDLSVVGSQTSPSTPTTTAPPVTTSTPLATNANPLSPQIQQQYDPWSKYRPQAGEELAGSIGQSSPSDIYKSKLAQMVGGQFSPSDPSYNWRFKQGQQAVERSLAAKGLLNSGNAAIELQQYGQGAASQEYSAQFSRLLSGMAGTEDVYNTQMDRLMKMAGIDIDPTSGGKLAIQSGQLGVEQGRLGLQGQELANDWYLKNAGLGLEQGKLGLSSQELANEWALKNRELGLKEQLGYQSMLTGGVGGMQGTNWSAIFGTQG